MAERKPNSEQRRRGVGTFFWLVFALLAAFIVLLALGAGRSTIEATLEGRSVLGGGDHQTRVAVSDIPKAADPRLS